MIDLPFSVLDVAALEKGATPGEALSSMSATAREVERLGFRRFWIAEHHGAQATASSVPPVMIARLSGETSTIRLGSGGVMLPNHNPYHVAEQFMTLEAYEPGRIDLGVGRGPGAHLESTKQALLRCAPSPTSDGYERDLATLIGYFRDTEVALIPEARTHVPEMWLLASSESGAALAAKLGLPLSFAYHLKPGNAESALAVYRRNFQPSPWLARPHVMVSVQTFCAETDLLAAELARPADIFLADVVAGGPGVLPTLEEAAQYEATEADERFFEERRRSRAQGSPASVARTLRRIIKANQPDEIMIFTPVYDLQKRLRSFQLLAEHVI
jgi:luciferase family oxidoreductase group 1